MPKERVVIIGAGVGGLAAAARLAAKGLSVDVFEMANAPGGKMRTVPSVAGPVDAGPTVMTLRPVFEALFADCNARLEDFVRLTAADVLARHWWPDGSSLDLYADRDRSRKAIAGFAGDSEADRFLRFCRRAERLFTAFDAPMMQAERPDPLTLTGQVLSNPTLIPAMAPMATLTRSLARSFTDPRLRQLFGRYATYVGGMPDHSPAILSLIWHAEASGVWAVDGGMHALAQGIAQLAERNGARFHYGTTVERINAAGAVTGVTLADGSVCPASHIVFNGDPAALAQGLLGPSPRMAKRKVSPRSLSAYVWAFASEPKGRDLSHHNVFFGKDPRSEFRDLAKGQMPNDPTLYLCAQDRGGGAKPSGAERFEIIMNGPPTSLGAVETEDICQTRTFRTLETMGLSFSPEPDGTALTTPADFARRFPGSDGSLYGRSPHGLMAAFHRPTARTRLPGLYLAGGGAHPGAGIPMATLSGKHAAAAIWNDLISTSTSRQTVMRGGMSTESASTANTQSPSSVS